MGNITYITKEELQTAFANHFIPHWGCTADDCGIISSMFPDAFDCVLCEEYIGEREIDGIEYVQFAVNTMLYQIGISDVPNFFFYVFYKSDELDGTVGSYKTAHKLYQIEGLKKKDFPKEFRKEM